MDVPAHTASELLSAVVEATDVRCHCEGGGPAASIGRHDDQVGSRDTLAIPARADVVASTIPGARLVTLEDRGHMLSLEDPGPVTDEVARAGKA
jgi:pimeloyl-ACP methyl ester carboxylesterase